MADNQDVYMGKIITAFDYIREREGSALSIKEAIKRRQGSDEVSPQLVAHPYYQEPSSESDQSHFELINFIMSSINGRTLAAEKIRQELQAKVMRETLSKWEWILPGSLSWQMEEKRLEHILLQFSEEMQVVRRVVLSRWERVLIVFSRRRLGMSLEQELEMLELEKWGRQRLKMLDRAEKETLEVLKVLVGLRLKRLKRKQQVVKAKEKKRREWYKEQQQQAFLGSRKHFRKMEEEEIQCAMYDEKLERLGLQERELQEKLAELPCLVEEIQLEQRWRAWMKLAYLAMKRRQKRASDELIISRRGVGTSFHVRRRS